jgi:hypothetical protein
MGGSQRDFDNTLLSRFSMFHNFDRAFVYDLNTKLAGTGYFYRLERKLFRHDDLINNYKTSNWDGFHL